MFPVRNNRRRRTSGFSLIELLIVIAIILIILAVALPKLTSARRYAQEMAAAKAITTIHTAETQYYSQYGVYATSLAQLGPPASGTPGPERRGTDRPGSGQRREGRLQVRPAANPDRLCAFRKSSCLRDQRHAYVLFGPEHEHPPAQWSGAGDGQRPSSRRDAATAAATRRWTPAAPPATAPPQ